MSMRLFPEQLGQVSRELSGKICPEGEHHCGTSWEPGKAEMKGLMLVWTPTLNLPEGGGASSGTVTPSRLERGFT